ncbi:hypothetical protein [Sphaerisporangium rhizosphaerae]|uniref:Uncharacterized protein n=1 Tax=Sphaerisporangium rhizosphaerae TaxID=2269375 RepID=A0ABW2PC08_9ACTN
MHVTVQLPIVDLRPLLPAETRRREPPRWPRPDRVFPGRSPEHHRSDHVRGVGAVRPRLRGGVAPWISESYYVDVGNLVRLTRQRHSEGFRKSVTVTPVLRNFYADRVVNRLEVGFQRRWLDPNEIWEGQENVVRLAMSAPTWLRGERGAHVPLVAFGPRFARHLLDSTSAAAEPEEWWVRAGTPSVVVEDYWWRHKAVHHAWVREAGQRVSMWHVTPSHEQDEPDEELRRMRMLLSRLHSEYAVVEQVLALCEDGRLEVGRPEVEGYLKRALDLLLRPSRFGFTAAEMLAQMLARTREVYADTVQTLDFLAGSSANPVIAARVEQLRVLMAAAESDRPFFYSPEVNVTAFNGNTFRNSAISTGTGDATVNNAPDDAADLRALVEDLLDAVYVLRDQLPEEQAVAVEDAANGVERELDKEPGKRSEGGLKARLKTIFEIATDAGAAGTALVGVVTAIQGMLGG